MAVLLTLLWVRTLTPALLAAAALVALAGAGLLWMQRRARSVVDIRQGDAARRAVVVTSAAALAVVMLAVGFGVWTEARMHRVTADWSGYVAQRQLRLRHALERRMDEVFRRGRRVAAAAAAAASAAHDPITGLFDQLDELREDSHVDAVAVFDGSGELVAWAGEHRGVLPDSVREGASPVQYAERPLFGYLYFSQGVDNRGGRGRSGAGGGSATAIVLLETGPPLGPGNPGGVAEGFARATGAVVRFGPGADSSADWSYRQGTQVVLHANLQPPGQSATMSQVAAEGRRLALGCLTLAFLLLAVGWVKLGGGPSRRVATPLLAAVLFLALAPLGAVLPVQPLFSPALFLLPVPGDITLGPLLAVFAPVAALVASWRAPTLGRQGFALAVLLGALAATGALAGLLSLMLDAAGPSLLEGSGYYWWGLQIALLLMGASVVGVAMPRSLEASGARTAAGPGRQALEARGGSREAGGSVRLSRRLVAGGLFLCAALATALVARWQAEATPPAESAARIWSSAALWTVPFAMIAAGLGRQRAVAGRLLRTLCAGCLAASFLLPHLWVTNLAAQVTAADRSLATLGSRSDPYVAYLLSRFKGDVLRHDEQGEAGIDLLFRSWVESGLAQEGYPVQLMLWDTLGNPTQELHLSGAQSAVPLSPSARRFLWNMVTEADTRGRPVIDLDPERLGANQVMAVPLEAGGGVSVVVPPRRTLDVTPALLGFLGARPVTEGRLTLIPGGEAPPASGGVIDWVRTDQGWRSEAMIRLPEGPYHAHLELRVPSILVRVARGTLIAAVDLTLLAVLWLLARAAEGAVRRPAGGWFAWARSFRARVTMALFAFFLLPTLLFGLFAYRALSGETVRAAQLLGEHAVEQAAQSFPASKNDLVAVSAQVGEELLYYLRGELIQASSPEAVQLGIYGAWMPPAVFLSLNSGEAITAYQLRQIAQTPYVVSFRALRPAGTLASPVSLAVSDVATRQRELAHLMLFAALAGGALSLALSFYVARALARPIARIREAAAAVGAGRLDARLPETRGDEFGELFTSFNRMVRQLRRARSREVRTARVLAWGEMARQVAHEIKNPLTPIRLSVQHLKRAFDDRRVDFAEILATNVDHVLAEIDRLADIARAFSRYGLPAESAGPMETIDVAAVVDETLTLYRAGDSGVRYQQEVPADLPPARARVAELKEVLVNLLENARAAVASNGAVWVSARARADAVEVEVRDDGAGIAPELLPLIFEPHFSTRTSGTGLGLAIVRRLVEGWGGDVRVESRPGKGTSVRIRVPLESGGRVGAGDGDPV
jgi:signal transduction histidine kinase